MQRRPRQLLAGGCGKWQQQAVLPQECRHPHRASFILVLWALHSAVSAFRPGKCALAPLATRSATVAAGAHSCGRPQGPACFLSWPAQQSTCAAGSGGMLCRGLATHTHKGQMVHCTSALVGGVGAPCHNTHSCWNGRCMVSAVCWRMCCRAHAGAQPEKATVHPHR